MPRVHTVKKAQKAYRKDGIKKGETYYWWQFAYSQKTRSKKYPKPQQLTRSGYMITLYDIDDAKDALSCTDGAETLREALDSIKESVETLKEECEESLENMPEHLQETSSSGELLTERIEGLDAYYDILDCITIDDDDAEDYLQERVDEIQECNI